MFLETKITINAVTEGHTESQLLKEASRLKLMPNKQIMSNPDARLKKLPHYLGVFLRDQDSDIFFLHDFQKSKSSLNFSDTLNDRNFSAASGASITYCGTANPEIFPCNDRINSIPFFTLVLK